MGYQKNTTGQFYSEDHCAMGILSSQEREIYELVHFYACEVDKLRKLVVEAMYLANELASGHASIPVSSIGEIFNNPSFDDYPAMARYCELFGEVPF